MAKVLFLHGLDARPGGVKPTYLIQCGHDVRNPALPREDFDQSVRIAQAEFDQYRPQVVVGSSRGGAVALAMDAGSTPLVLLAPAWKYFPISPTKSPRLVRILHSPGDSLIPIADSRELCSHWSGTDGSAQLIETGWDHAMVDPASLETLNRAVRELACS